MTNKKSLEKFILRADVLAILDRKSIEAGQISREFLSRFNIAKDLDRSIKTYILVEEEEELSIYFSKISSKTLEKRDILSVWR